MVRAGWAKQKWSVDGFGTRVGRHRGEIIGESSLDVQGDSIPETSSTRTDAYFRVAYADPDVDKAWAQVMTVASRYVYTGFRSAFTGIPTTHAESLLAIAPLDTSRYMAQYVATAGTVQGPFRASGTARAFVSGGQTILAPAARASFTTERVSVSGYAEAKSADSIARADVTFRLQPLSFISLLGSVARSTNYRANDVGLTTTYLRGEAGLRLHELWLIGGVVRRDSALLAPATRIRHELHRATRSRRDRIRGGDSRQAVGPPRRRRLWNSLERFDGRVSAAVPNAVGAVRADEPRQPVPDARLRADGVDRFTSTGPTSISRRSSRASRRSAPGSARSRSLLEIRMLNATVSWQFRNMLGERYSEIGGFIMPRQTNLLRRALGVRRLTNLLVSP